METKRRPSVAIVGTPSNCSGCEFGLADDGPISEVLRYADLRHCRFLATGGPLVGVDIALIAGAVATPETAEYLQELRRHARVVIAIGNCAVAGGKQARITDETLARAHAGGFGPCIQNLQLQRPCPVSTAIPVDMEIRGCPCDPSDVLRKTSLALQGMYDRPCGGSVCSDCKRAGNSCTYRDTKSTVICLGPITKGGCGAICTPHGGCRGCKGLNPGANVKAFVTETAKKRNLNQEEVWRKLQLLLQATERK